MIGAGLLLAGATRPAAQPQLKPLPEPPPDEPPDESPDELVALVRNGENFCRVLNEPQLGHWRSSFLRKPCTKSSKTWPHSRQTRS